VQPNTEQCRPLLACGATSRSRVGVPNKACVLPVFI